MQNNEKPIVLSAVLLIISVVVAFLLAFTNSITKDKIVPFSAILTSIIFPIFLPSTILTISLFCKSESFI